MKKLALVLLLSSSSVALADNNLVQNGDFSSGIAHWEGDCHSFDSSDAPPDPSASLTSTSAPQGVYIKLRHRDWTKMMQDFNGGVGEYVLTVSYSLSSDTKLSTSPADYADIPGSNSFNLFRPFSGTPGRWCVIISDLGSWRYSYYEVKTDGAAGTTVTFTAPVKLNSDDEEKKGLVFVFPPGDGIVTIKNVSLVPTQAP